MAKRLAVNWAAALVARHAPISADHQLSAFVSSSSAIETVGMAANASTAINAAKITLMTGLPIVLQGLG